jgi:hypothetical protein
MPGKGEGNKRVNKETTARIEKKAYNRKEEECRCTSFPIGKEKKP